MVWWIPIRVVPRAEPASQAPLSVLERALRSSGCSTTCGSHAVSVRMPSSANAVRRATLRARTALRRNGPSHSCRWPPRLPVVDPASARGRRPRPAGPRGRHDQSSSGRPRSAPPDGRHLAARVRRGDRQDGYAGLLRHRLGQPGGRAAADTDSEISVRPSDAGYSFPRQAWARAGHSGPSAPPRPGRAAQRGRPRAPPSSTESRC